MRKDDSTVARRQCGASTVSAPDTLPVSAIIATKERPSELQQTLLSLLHQSRTPDTIVVVDQSFSSSSRLAVEALFGAPPDCARTPRLLYVLDPSISGLAAARNRGMTMAPPGIWLFLDDDVQLEPGFVQALCEAYSLNPDISGAAGVITNYKRPAPLYRVWERFFCRGPFHDERQPLYWRNQLLNAASPVPVKKFTGAGMSFRSARVQTLSFDERLTGVCDGEDIEFCQRVTGPLVIVPGARYRHHRSPTGRSKQHWVHRHALANTYIYYLHWRCSPLNRVRFGWLSLGYLVLALAGCLRRGNSSAWRALRQARGQALRLATASPRRA